LHSHWIRCSTTQRFRFGFAAVAAHILCIHLLNGAELANAAQPNVFGGS
jgi:hypothetical protein